MKTTKRDHNAIKIKNLGTHIICDFFDCKNKIESTESIENILAKAVKDSSGYLLAIKSHKFSPHGLTSFALLAESHISIHTWPEYGFVACDIFSCGRKMKPMRAVKVLRDVFKPGKVNITKIKRGRPELIETKLTGDWHFDRSFSSSSFEYMQDTGVKSGLAIKKRIFKINSPSQVLEVIETKPYGRALILDGILQTTEKDEFLYHEMIVHPAMMFHKNPSRVLVIGGGDGGALREVLKYPSVRELFLVELDKKVVEACGKYLPSLNAGAFNDPRVNIVFEDGINFVKKYSDYFDVIIVDSSDPIGPAKKLFAKNFYQNIFSALKKDGVVSMQGGTFYFWPWDNAPEIFVKLLGKIFKTAEMRSVFMPSYGESQAFILASKNNAAKNNLSALKTKFKKLNLLCRYYTPEVHFSSKILPGIKKNPL